MKKRTDWKKVALSAEKKLREIHGVLASLRYDQKQDGYEVTDHHRLLMMTIPINDIKYIADNIKAGREQ